MSFPIRQLQTRKQEPITKPYAPQGVNNGGDTVPHSYPDIVLISTDDDFESDNRELLRQAQHYHLEVEKVFMATKNGSDLRKKIQQLHRNHKLGPDTQVFISLHGQKDKTGVHRVSGNRDNFMVTTRLLELLRKPPPGCPAKKWNGNIHINACKIGLIREQVAQMPGTYFLYGGKKNTLTADGTETFGNVFRLIGLNKERKIADKHYPGISAKELFYESAVFSGESVSLHENKKSWLSNPSHPNTGNLTVDKVNLSEQARRALNSRLKRSSTLKVKNILPRLDNDLLSDPKHFIELLEKALTSTRESGLKIKLLLESYSNINAVDKNGNTALMIASESKDHRLLEYLLHAGADPNIPNTEGFRPIHMAIANGNNEALTLLLKKGATVDAQGDRVIAPIFLALQKKNEKLILTILRYRKIDFEITHNKDTAFAIACKTLSNNVIAEMLIMGADAFDPDWDDITPLEFAVRSNNPVLVFMLLTIPKVIWPDNALAKKIISINDDEIKNEDMTLLFKKMNEILPILRHTKLIDAVDANGLTPLQDAAKNKNWLKADLLVKAGANVDLDPSKSGTPLMLFAENGDVSIVDLLLMYRADTSIKNKAGKTVMEIALENNQVEIVNLLENAATKENSEGWI